MRDIGILVLGALLIGTFYLSFVSFPQRRALRKQQLYVETLHIGDQVITFGGIVGEIVRLDMDEGVVHLEIADGVVVRVLSQALVQTAEPQETH